MDSADTADKAATTLENLILLSRELGREDRGLAILGEGNTSADNGDGTFWIKASGSQLGTIDAGGFSRIRLATVLDLLAGARLSDTEVAAGLQAALVDPAHRQPSVEIFLHAVCLAEGGARWVGHTHTLSVNQILCSGRGAEPFLHHLFPDAIVVCGIAPAVMPYVDPGYQLGLAVRAELRRYRAAYGRPPKMLLMINHGVVALGQTDTEVLNILLMADKWARVLHGTYALGGPHFLSEEDVRRIDSRLDEHYRRGRLTGA
jgi:rhamnose utilization protein RhaD (predicted bifunctional aldolase and dehydrogenase)